tara:strand:+ start:4138 stop:4533 length:396 start_codon:yes stop_codon:yes gene_type:complete
MSDVKQMKLFSGEEILCDLVDIEYEDDAGTCFVIRAAYLLISKEDFDNNMRYYTFRPFMMHVMDPGHVLILNADSVICMTHPEKSIEKQYLGHVEMIREEMVLDDDDDEDSAMDEETSVSDGVIPFKPRLH